MARLIVFQSTHPMRGATVNATINPAVAMISIHAPHEGCDAVIVGVITPGQDISIHALHEGCDQFVRFLDTQPVLFQSTHPMRGATARSDTSTCFLLNFNPRTP